MIDDKGLIERSKIDHKMPLRKETSEATQRPTAQTKSVKSDRGTFKDKC